MDLYWGDLHNHCGISYGYGSLANALAAARTQLDFCAVTGHALWPDIPPRTPATDYLVDFHEKGFRRLAAGWEGVLKAVAGANVPGEFVTFQSYEMHSRRYGDHHVLSPADDLPLLDHADSPRDLVAALAPRPAIAVPHHIGYVPGYRGIAWEDFDPALSPLVEVYSKHGSGFADDGPYPYLHTMGPREGRNTALAALARGVRLGFTASTDHHAGYPGSYGDGRVAVWAEALTREALWEALLARRTYAVTGDKIACDLRVDGATMGSSVPARASHEVTLRVRGSDRLDRVILYRGGVPWQDLPLATRRGAGPANAYKVRVEMGWGYSPEPHRWEGTLAVEGGVIATVEPCFRGQSILAPSRDQRDDDDINALENRVLHQGPYECAWRCHSFKNPSTLHPATAAVVVEVAGGPSAALRLTLNGQERLLPLADLLASSRGYHLQPYASEAFLVHRAVPEAEYTLEAAWTDVAPPAGGTSYCAEVRQANGQCAWLSPVYVET